MGTIERVSEVRNEYKHRILDLKREIKELNEQIELLKDEVTTLRSKWKLIFGYFYHVWL